MPKFSLFGEPPPPPEGPVVPPRREGDLLLPLAAAVCIFLGWYVFLDYEQAAMVWAEQAPVLLRRIWALRVMLVLASISGMGLVWLAVRDARRRRTAEAELERLNAELAHRVELRTATLRVRTRELHDSRLRERLREKESEVAFQAGQVQAAGAYLHGVGNALSALEVELLRLAKTLGQARRVEDVFDTLAKSLEAGNRQETDRLLAALREVVLVRGFERLTGSLAALTDIKSRMADELERRRGEFERSGPPTPYLQTFRVDLELAAVLDRLPRAVGSDPVVRDIGKAVTVSNRKHPYLTGLASLLRQTLDAAPRGVVVRLRQEAQRAVVTVEGAGEDGVRGPAVAEFIDFLNENNGSFRFEVATADHPSRLEVSLGNAASCLPLS